MPNNFLVQHAKSTVWCNPEADRQIVLNAQRITPRNGVADTHIVLNRTMLLPNKTGRFHIYQVGAAYPSTVNLLPMRHYWEPEGWVNFSEYLNLTSVFVNVYTDNGVQLPLFKSYFMQSREKGIFFAIELPNNPDTDLDLNIDELYVRLFKNAYFSLLSKEYSLSAKGAEIETTEKILSLQSDYYIKRSKGGHVFLTINGEASDELSPLTVKVGDIVEYVHDMTVKGYMRIAIRDLHTFYSEIDKEYKYLLHFSGDDKTEIVYENGVDIFVITNTSPTSYTGRYYHRNKKHSHRSVTHRDISIMVDSTLHIARGLNRHLTGDVNDVNDYEVLIYIRDVDLNRSLVFESNRTFDLYRLSDEEIIVMLIGTDSRYIPLWRAENLEKSVSSQLYNTDIEDINNEYVTEAYGYNAIEKILAPQIQKTYSDYGIKIADLPLAYKGNAIAFEYDEEGLFTWYFQHNQNTAYRCRYADTSLVEFVKGESAKGQNFITGIENVRVDTTKPYRIYVRKPVDLSPTPWKDVTYSEDISIVNNRVLYSGNIDQPVIRVQYDDKVAIKDFTTTMTGGTLSFYLSEEVEVDGILTERNVDIEPGTIDIFLNRQLLIRDVDYKIDLPLVHVFAKEALKQPADITPQQFHIRMYGFSRPDGTQQDIVEHGYIQHGLISASNKFQARDDKSIRISVSGRVKHRDDVNFAEDDSEANFTHELNGLPYELKRPLLNFGVFTNTDDYLERYKAQETDKQVNDILNILKPEPPKGHYGVRKAYSVFSGFFSRIIYVLAADILTVEDLGYFRSKREVNKVIEQYLPLLEYDPVNAESGYDYSAVTIHPHPYSTFVELDHVKYQFLNQVVEYYGNDLFALNNFVLIKKV